MVKYTLKKSVVFVGLMGSGKSSIGRRLGEKIDIQFVDSDDEIELAAGMTISEIFNKFGEPYFRAGEERVVNRLLSGEPKVIATGGGAFLSERVRSVIDLHGFSIWLKADLDTLWARLHGKGNRPLLKVSRPKEKLKRLIEERNPIYGMANIMVQSKKNTTHAAMVLKLIKLLQNNKVLEFN
ncbi:MAG: shikimate kinase [Pseudomonadota bacterium]|nr:shikimate kinase [Pseudomonadota bacterium]